MLARSKNRFPDSMFWLGLNVIRWHDRERMDCSLDSVAPAGTLQGLRCPWSVLIREGRQTARRFLFSSMSWIYLVLAGLCEIGWPLGFKLSQAPGTGSGRFAACIAFSILSMALSGFLLWLAQRNIPIGTAYAVWTGIGALGTFMVGIIWFGDSSNVWRMLAATFLLIGIIGLKMAPGH